MRPILCILIKGDPLEEKETDKEDKGASVSFIEKMSTLFSHSCPILILLFNSRYSSIKAKAGKKKSTPNKRPASAISIGTVKNPSSAKKDEKARKAKSPKIQSDHTISESIKDVAKDCATYSSASRDTLLDYGYYSNASNPSKVNSSGSRLSATSPAVPKPVPSTGVGSGSKLGVASPVLSKPYTNAKSTGQKKLDNFFAPVKSSHNNSKTNVNNQEGQNDQAKATSQMAQQPQQQQPMSNDFSTDTSSQSTQHLHDKISSLEKQLAEATSHNLAIKNNQTMLTLQLQSTVKRQAMEISQLKSQSESLALTSTKVIETLIRAESLRKTAEMRQRLASDGARLGRLVTTRSRGGLQRSIESWEDGEEPMKLKKRREELKKKREALEKRWGELMHHDVSGGLDMGANSDGESSNAERRPMDDLEKFEAQETIRMHLEEVKRDERRLDEEDRMLTLEKRKHVRMLKLVGNEDASKFRFREKVSI